MAKSWPVVAVGALVWKNDALLLIRRGQPPRQGLWSIPGGRQEAGETLQQAVHREIKEETNIDIDIIELAAVVDLIDRQGDEILYHYTVIDFAAEWRDGEVTAGDDAADAAWFTPAQLLAVELPDQQRKVIADAARKRKAGLRCDAKDFL